MSVMQISSFCSYEFLSSAPKTETHLSKSASIYPSSIGGGKKPVNGEICLFKGQGRALRYEAFSCNPSSILKTGRTKTRFLLKASLNVREGPKSSISPSQTSDLFLLDLAEKLEDSISKNDAVGSGGIALKGLRDHSAEAIVNLKWPTSKTEAYRFTDVKFLRDFEIWPSNASPENDVDLSSLHLGETDSLRLVFVDGVLSTTLSNLHDVPEELIIGSVLTLPDKQVDSLIASKLLGSASGDDSDLFATLNGIGARDVGVVILLSGLKVEKPLHVVYYSSENRSYTGSSGSQISLSSPRLLVVVEKGAELDLVEEFVGASQTVYWSNSVSEIFVSQGAKVTHSYVQTQERTSVHIKKTFVSQDDSSIYKLVEAGVGGRLSRHNLHIEQSGPETTTEVSTFQLAGTKQLQDLHSRIVLSHPHGCSRQLHKCIVMSSSGHAVFDGNVRVNRYAQNTDAGQLSRSLLLAPRATVNIKPNLQIVADDVKCSHGAAISDLEEEQLFYFRARGIDAQTARSALVFSFAAEVIERISYKDLRERLQHIVKESLAAEGVVKAKAFIGLSDER
ncbi:hypothetical protein O6H91_22G055000 [Diphasiastrum complanatum]|uniref:Uncharacterized protein n=1 Tax=Diphasiastrum complanatum TaxID=34168 RepID=A0ACC2AFL4_DIPCM|nr:hypothetical protein O6H91_22G055000 [Diphasiastrum complanatum]